MEEEEEEEEEEEGTLSRVAVRLGEDKGLSLGGEDLVGREEARR